ncbi:threonine--tRNA ligase (plasmid) [Haloferax mediterranei ATCC 33500]|uniref:Threonine--tRNA ligase n=1 Tax=Haloferax mediterranei (strain ATCC 33500 / DSM 1411 / JCM 8866 / NBRC 14739 / NCIMB 2177 / R-4) TaxID=523841 RepID=I3R9U0_HALMT|nr:threonine--tRNA ligase [Haloferax mediterranei]AFK21000.1 threonyl-tRNA synthetase [Haloferax mediterranei ATCC 33500]AHZ24138.1 threonyl-tRNA synthetase [Haloferax mediterranei ATCC 33500]EMA05214.1 threonyl-tRNA ligase [Haloferax mediterranei ATCC 33500]MDX5989981.1 threonine--tRNA ligase [Haloferax mediterranei ATCC 33500]QCQ77164.1 threonine--tRNA ligase [Haloferax mediterranei ATCC 33500]
MSQQNSSTIVVTLPDGSERHVPRGTTVEEVAYRIGEGLGRDTVAGIVDHELVAAAEPITEDATVEIVTESSDEYLDVLRHSAAHIFAQALQRLHPEAKLAIGPYTDEGFYYDIYGVDLNGDDLAEIQAEAEEIIEADYDIERVELDREDAFEYYDDNQFKREILEQEAAGEDPVTFYRQGEFQDLCKGPHVSSTGKIGGFELLDISAAYWRGDEENESLTRVYGTAFESESELEDYLELRREAEKRDHRKLARELDLFSIPAHSPGCVHYHPNGMAIRRELEAYIREKNEDLGYDEVRTPELNKAKLWQKSGHYENFRENGEMFAWEQDDTEYGLKPMNCANHSHIYDTSMRSYRDLPIRFSEFGNVFRNEQSGELSGLLRVRGLTQDDGHAYVRPDQIQSEILNILQAIEDIYSHFGLEVLYKLETRGENAIGGEALWEQATDALRDALHEKNLDFDIESGEAAFYGPKIGINARDALGREWTIGTVQVDFNIPRRLDLTYVGEDNKEHYPVMIHRALLGSFERFMGVIIEHFDGKFPTWLAPEQIRVLPISDDNLDYAREVASELDEYRVEIEDRSWTIGKKIQTAHEDRVPYMIIVGDDEEGSNTISVRDRKEREANDIERDAFRNHLEREVTQKHLEPTFLAGQ